MSDDRLTDYEQQLFDDFWNESWEIPELATAILEKGVRMAEWLVQELRTRIDAFRSAETAEKLTRFAQGGKR